MTISLNSGSNAIIPSRMNNLHYKHTKETINSRNLNCKKRKISSSIFLQSNAHKKNEIYKFKIGQSFDKIMTFCEKQPAIEARKKESIENKIYKRKVGRLFDEIYKTNSFGFLLIQRKSQ